MLELNEIKNYWVYTKIIGEYKYFETVRDSIVFDGDKCTMLRAEGNKRVVRIIFKLSNEDWNEIIKCYVLLWNKIEHIEERKLIKL